MVTQQQVLDALRQIGLNLYERKLWVALLSRGVSTAGELSSLARVPHSRTYDVLESLEEKGFVMIQTAKPLKYVAMNPSEALERAKKKLKENTDISVQRITQLQNSSITKELERIHKTGVKLVEPGEMTGSLKGRQSLHAQLDTLFKSAKSNISVLMTPKTLEEFHSKHVDVLKKASNRGVKIRIATTSGKEVSQAANGFKGIAEVRTVSKSDVSGRFAVVDGQHAVILLTDEEDVHPTQDLALWTQSEHVASDVLGPMFDMIWQRAESA